MMPKAYFWVILIFNVNDQKQIFQVISDVYNTTNEILIP